MSKHTQGPWGRGELDGESVYIWAYRSEGDDEGRLIGSASAEEVPEAECEANARLIAAAPELLDACIHLLHWQEMERTNVGARHGPALLRTALEKARAAIANARGEA